MTKGLKRIANVLKRSFQLLTNGTPILLSAATAFFTTFALSPTLIILSHLLNLFFDEKIILPKLFAKIAITFGRHAANDIREIVEGFKSLQTSLFLNILFTIFFYFVATTLLSAIRQSIHTLWQIKKKPERKTNYHLKERGIEIAIILLIAVLFLLTLLLDQGLHALRQLLPTGTASDVAIKVINGTLAILVVSTWFTFVFKYLPEALVKWRVAIAGGIFTGILFFGGRLFLTKILVNSKIEEIFGPSSSIALVLLFIFYWSFVLYFGACFTIEYAKSVHRPVRPGRLGERYEEVVASKR